MNPYPEMSRSELLKACEMHAKNWLAHDGCWFLAAEQEYGLKSAIELDLAAWRRFAKVEARRIATTFGLETDGGLAALERALGLRAYALINRQHVEWSTDRRSLRFFMDVCKVQQTRRAKGLADFPCKQVGLVEFSTFAATIDQRVAVTCLHCPPDADPGQYCGWEFSLASGGDEG